MRKLVISQIQVLFGLILGFFKNKPEKAVSSWHPAEVNRSVGIYDR